MDGTGTAGLQLPRLPQLDKRDVEAVRNFLPGKVLGRTAALLSLLLLVLGLAGGVDWMIEQRLGIHLEAMPWLRATVLGGLPLLVVATQVALEWQAERQRRRLQALAVEPSRVPLGYFRIGPYLGVDRDRFDRADEAQWKVLDWIRHADGMPLYLTGDSGCGKSSLLNACVIPILREAGWTVLEPRSWQDPVMALQQALRHLVGTADQPRSLRASMEAAAEAAGGNLLVVMDQFEEFIVLSTDEARARIVALLDDLRADPIAGLRVLLVLRSDYEALVEDCGLPPLRQRENHVFIGRFTLTAARSFMAHSSLGLTNEQLARLLATAAVLDETPGLIRPITLNVLGTVLSAGQPTAPSLDARLLIRRYIEQIVAQPVLRDRVPAVLGSLISGYETNRPMPELELVRETKLRRGEVRAVMNGLVAGGLVRPLDSEQAVWELSHDFIARAVARHLGARRRDALRHGAAYAAPSLLLLTIMGGGVMVAWQQFSPYKLSPELADLGVKVTIEAGHADVEKNSHFSLERFAGSTGLLARLNAVVPIRSVDLSGTPVAKLEPLKGLNTLTTLYLTGSDVADLEPLKSLTALTTLDLSGTPVASLEPLRGLTALTTLYLVGRRPVANLEPLKGLNTLTMLYLSGSNVADLEPLKGLTALTTLDLSGTPVANLEPLKGLNTLTTLYLSGTPVANLEPLKGLTALTTLDLSGTPVANLEPLKGLNTLTTLYLSGTPVASLEPLRGLTALTTLYLIGAMPVPNLEPLQNLPRIRFARDIRGRFLPESITEEERSRFAAYRASKGLPPAW